METFLPFSKQPEGTEQVKPPFLYHGSVAGNIQSFIPRGAKNRPAEPPAVYATPYLEIAIQSMANAYASNGGILDGRRFVCIPMTRKEFEQKDTGGSVYALPSETFTINNSGGGFGGSMEWVSTETVTPSSQQHYPSLLQALLQQGVEVYFVDPGIVDTITAAQMSANPEDLKQVLAGLKRTT